MKYHRKVCLVSCISSMVSGNFWAWILILWFGNWGNQMTSYQEMFLFSNDSIVVFISSNKLGY